MEALVQIGKKNVNDSTAKSILEVIAKLQKSLPEDKVEGVLSKALQIRKEGYDFKVIYEPEGGHEEIRTKVVGYYRGGDPFDYEIVEEKEWVFDSPERVEINKTTPLAEKTDNTKPQTSPFEPVSSEKARTAKREVNVAVVVRGGEVVSIGGVGALSREEMDALRELVAYSTYLAQAPPVEIVVTSDLTATEGSLMAVTTVEGRQVLAINLFAISKLAELKAVEKQNFLVFLTALIEGHEVFHLQGMNEAEARRATVVY